MRQLILHAGAGKTGTSALQLFFDDHAGWLAEQGIRYPAGPHRPDPRTRISSGNGGYLYGFLRRGEHWDDVIDQLDSAGPTGDVLLSSELLAGAYPEHLVTLRDRVAERGFVLRPFYLVRNPDEWYLSAYQQLVKRHGYVGGFADFCSGYKFEFEIALRSYESALGTGALRILSYEAGKQDIISYVLRQALGIAATPPPYSNPLINRSLTGFELEVLRTATSIQRGRGTATDTIESRATRFSDHLIAARPTIPRDARFRQPMPVDVVERLQPVVDTLNARLDDGEIAFTVHEQSTPLGPADEESARMCGLLLLQQQELLESQEGSSQAVARLEAAAQAAAREGEARAAEIVALRTSTSWRVTAPLRALTAAVRGQRDRRSEVPAPGQRASRRHPR